MLLCMCARASHANHNLRHPASAVVARAQNPERNDIQEVLESLEGVDFADMADLVEHLHPLMCGYISAALEDDKPATALDMMVCYHPLSLSNHQASFWHRRTLIHDPKHTLYDNDTCVRASAQHLQPLQDLGRSCFWAAAALTRLDAGSCARAGPTPGLLQCVSRKAAGPRAVCRCLPRQVGRVH